jgi:uncharacterized protein (TIGR02246 family)
VNAGGTNDETEIRELLAALTEAWSRGDAQAYGAHYRLDGTFTNVFGDFYIGRDEFNRRS